MATPRIHITGASRAGVSALGAALARRLGCVNFDTDDFFWKPTDPPFHERRDLAERLDLITAALDGASLGWALSGSLDGWGDPLIPRFERVIFLETSTDVRMARLRERERRRYGAAIEPGGELHAHHLDFLAFAAAYETGQFTGTLRGRCRARHEAWLSRLPCPVIRLDGARPTQDLVDEACEEA
jgi:adenylate kinase family enzyme